MTGTVENRRKGSWQRTLAALFVCVLLACALTACGSKDKKGVGQELGTGEDAKEDVIVWVGDKEVTRDEIMFYVLCVREQYEGYFGKEIWSVDFGNGRTFEDMCKEDILNEIVQLKVITSMAEKNGVEVTEDEADEIADTVREQLEEINETDAAKYHITTELLERIYHDNYLSSKMFDVVTGEVDTNVPDTEARRAHFQVLTILTKGTDRNRNEIDMTPEEKSEARTRVDELWTQASESEDFAAFAAVHSDLEETDLVIGRGVQETAFDRAAFRLKTGELSKVVEGRNAFYIIYCVNEFDEDATAQTKEDIISDRQEEAFKALYGGWVKDFKVTVDEAEWAGITFEE